MKNHKLSVFVLIVVIFAVAWFSKINNTNINNTRDDVNNIAEENLGGLDSTTPHPLSIEALKNGEYPGSDIVIEQTLSPGSNYQRHIVSYKSEGLKIFALLTIPNGDAPESGWPAIIFNHGYIPPNEYKTTERYVAYTDVFSRNGYILLRPDYRGHGNSEGEPTGAYGSNGYTIDVLNAVSSLKKYEGVDSNNIGMWGHSMGGHITLKNMVVRDDVKAGVIWAGVVGSYEDLFDRWRRRNESSPSPNASASPSTRGGRRWRQELTESYGSPSDNPEFWASLSANSYLQDLSGPIQLHHGTADTSVPFEFSEELDEQIRKVNGISELYLYNGDDHNISNNFTLAANRSVEFFDRYLKLE